MQPLLAPLRFPRGPAMPNRFMVAPLTNSSSHADGTISEREHRWLEMRAQGGFGATMTCAAHVQAVGQGFPGQLGVFGDQHLPGLTGIAHAIRAHGSVALMQLHHAGNRSPKALIGTTPVCPSDDPVSGARSLTTAEVEALAEDFIAAARRAELAGFHGVELHGAHGYILCQFLSDEINQRQDRYGGSLDNRARLLLDIIDGIRRVCGPDFIVGVRLSPERFGMRLAEIRELAQRLIDGGQVDFLDMSLWNCFKHAIEPGFDHKPLIDWFGDLERRNVPVGAAGKLYQPAEAQRALDAGMDFVLLGRMAILHHDYPARLAADPEFSPSGLPVSVDYLTSEGLGPEFVEYMRQWKGFVAD
ncbi:MAG: NADH:flavin oxidoreductase [Pseudomonadales bacterium]|nr:NADH:flavin oxidoreductase [Pseudomonadales bacterium]MCP5182341.1 NADH:flavin oxidoreductase [Pseudomonadales bacterium]